MSKLYVLIFAIACSISHAGMSSAEIDIIGEWAGTDSDGDAVTLVFNEDKSAEVLFEGLPPLTSKNLAKGSVEWVLLSNYEPMHLDIIIFTGTEESSRLRMLARFVDNQTLDIRNSRDMVTRPKEFVMTDTVYQILLKRQ